MDNQNDQMHISLINHGFPVGKAILYGGPESESESIKVIGECSARTANGAIRAFSPKPGLQMELYEPLVLSPDCKWSYTSL